MNIDAVIKKAIKEDITEQDALSIFKGSWSSVSYTLELFKAACKVRENFVKNMLTPFMLATSGRECKLDPLYKYCFCFS